MWIVLWSVEIESTEICDMKGVTQGWVYEILRKTLSQPILEVFKGLTVWGMVCLKYWHQKLKRPKIWRTTLSGLTRELRYPVIPGVYLILSRSLINTEYLNIFTRLNQKGQTENIKQDKCPQLVSICEIKIPDIKKLK